MITDLTHTLHEMLKKQLEQTHFDVVKVHPFPNLEELMLGIKKIQGTLLEFQKNQESETAQYLVKVKPKERLTTVIVDKEMARQKPSLDGIYLPNGKLNVPYLMKNADLLFEAGDYLLARKIYRAILQTGEFVSTALCRIGKCFEAEGKLAEACSHYEESITYHPSLDAYQRLAAILVRQNKHKQAAEVMERAFNLKGILSHQARLSQ